MGRRAEGFTLVELVIAIVILAIAVAGVLLAFQQTAARSADPLLVQQAVAVAEAYLEEIQLRAFDDPDGADGEASRADYDDVDDYDGLSDLGARDQEGNAVAGLGDYRVDVAVAHAALHTVPAADAYRIEVRVRHQRRADVDVTLTGYRTRY
ncbi:type II secretion system protein [Inmirania thermothiophila]|uniref:MSHA pilin protein MshD n=1 Tax=Inmirania thermothiophila TaxID=1750597 RepID=A0A3N1Y9X5_9GAMM|nr:type II secretion system protein [Inmirania thermothiophila]ROR34197.1 MSHA pilin protein MshD [Inmirania thermothiophila]